MPYNSKPGARKYGDKPQSMSGFKMRSGNGPLPFKQMGATPVKQLDSIFGTMPGDQKIKIEDPNKDPNSTVERVTKQATKGPEVKKENKKEPPKPKEKNWREKKSDFKDQKKDFRKTRKDFKKGNKEEIAELKASGASRDEIKAAKKVNKQEQKDLKQAHKDDNKTAKQNYKNDAGYKEHKAQQRKELSEGLMDLGQSRTFQGKGAKSFVELQSDRDVGKRADKDAKAKEIATAEANKKDAINATQKAEMHKSQLAVNDQNIAASKALEAKRLQGVEVAEENISKEKELDADEPTAIIKGGGKNLNTNA